MAYELKHFLRHKRKEKQGFISIKIDITKTYDRVEWHCLKRVMGLNVRMVNLIMGCVTLSFFSILIYGILKDYIIPNRGLRQGDHLSPYLFLLCTKGIINLLSKSVHDNTILGIRVCRYAPTINHLLFAENNIFFFARLMLILLEMYKGYY